MTWVDVVLCVYGLLAFFAGMFFSGAAGRRSK
jgi:hypothetical protein